MPGMETPFGVPWDEVNHASLTEFFREPREEGQVWEGKGRTIRPEMVRRSVGGFANSVLGGYLILGIAADTDGRWQLSGWEPPGEAGQWITDCLSGRMDPPPTFDVKSWRTADGSTISVVRTWPVAIPPCVTAEGYVFERVGATTSQVKEAVTLHRLFERGETARRRAWEQSRSARAAFAMGNEAGRTHSISLSIASAGLAGDISDRIFVEGFARLLTDRVRALPLHAGGLTPTIRAAVSQEAVTVFSTEGAEGREGYTAHANRHGGISVGWNDPEVPSGLRAVTTVPNRLEDLWVVAAAATEAIGGTGAAHMAVRLLDGSNSAVDVDRWLSSADVDPQVLESVSREANRALGAMHWEPHR
jgi:hypothetical protein